MFNHVCLLVLALVTNVPAMWIAATLSSTKENQIEDSDCPTFCSRVYVPVCGFDGMQFQIFSNECMMKSMNCDRDQAWTKSEMTRCSADRELNILTQLTEIGRDKMQLKKSESESELLLCSQKFCSSIWAPICATDAGGSKRRIFDNQCEFKIANCKDNNKWKSLRSTECPEQQTLGDLIIRNL